MYRTLLFALALLVLAGCGGAPRTVDTPRTFSMTIPSTPMSTPATSPSPPSAVPLSPVDMEVLTSLLGSDGYAQNSKGYWEAVDPDKPTLKVDPEGITEISAQNGSLHCKVSPSPSTPQQARLMLVYAQANKLSSGISTPYPWGNGIASILRCTHS